MQAADVSPRVAARSPKGHIPRVHSQRDRQESVAGPAFRWRRSGTPTHMDGRHASGARSGGKNLTLLHFAVASSVTCLLACGGEATASPPPPIDGFTAPSGAGGSASSGNGGASAGGTEQAGSSGIGAGLASGSGAVTGSGAGGYGPSYGGTGSSEVPPTQGAGGSIGESGGAQGAGGRLAGGGRRGAGGSLNASGGAIGAGGASEAGDGGPTSCSNGIKDGAETDVDCGGGACPRCDGGKTCSAAADCASDRCVAGVGGGGRTCQPED